MLSYKLFFTASHSTAAYTFQQVVATREIIYDILLRAGGASDVRGCNLCSPLCNKILRLLPS
jgi:hypothetical protein